MKVSKIPGCGRFGVFIDDVNFETMSDEEWMEIGKIHLDSLVTIIRDTKLDVTTYHKFMKKWGRDRLTYHGMFFEKYKGWDGKIETALNSPEWSDTDKASVMNFVRMREGDSKEAGNVLRVSGKKDTDGNPIGMFAEGELLWHSNESGNIGFAPAVALLASQGTTKSATGFLTTVDYYESVSESFRSELDEMILIHNFIPGKINPGLRDWQDKLMYDNMAPDENAEIPMVIRSPAGHIGLHYSFNTVTGIKGMKKEESDKLLARIRNELEVDEYIYDHWYQQDGDLCLFDNSITQHRRLGETENRLCYRYQYDYTHLQNGPWIPYRQQPYIDRYIDRVTAVAKGMQINGFKFPTLNDVVDWKQEALEKV